MKRLAFPLALAILLLSLLAAQAQPGKEDTKKILGTWTVTRIEKDGANIAPGEFKLKFADKQIELVGQEDNASAYKLGVEKTLGTIDLTPAKGADQGKTFKGIYELKGDELKICMPENSEKERPKEMTSKGGYGIVHLKRDKP